MIFSIILLAALGNESDFSIVFVSSFNGIEGSECVMLSPPHPSTYEVQKVRAKKDGSRLYLLEDASTVKVDQPVSLFLPDGSLLSGTIKQNTTIVFHQTTLTQVAQIGAFKPTNAFLITTGTTYEGLRGPLAALILTISPSKNEVFSARYDQIGTIFVAKSTDFDPNSVISVLIYAENGQKWLYSGKIDGKLLRFDKSKFPKGPL